MARKPSDAYTQALGLYFITYERTFEMFKELLVAVFKESSKVHDASIYILLDDMDAGRIVEKGKKIFTLYNKEEPMKSHFVIPAVPSPKVFLHTYPFYDLL
jgi:hypothetical protein